MSPAPPRRPRLRAGWLAIGVVAALWAPAAQAASLQYCDKGVDPSPAQKDRLFRFGALIKQRLDESGQRLALVSRSGLDLARLGMRYSHAGFSLKASANAPWSVRQLYFACDEGRPRLFDQGISGFLLGTDDPQLGYVSVLLLPDSHAEPLERAALNNRLALQLLASTYSANAYAFNRLYQNCNQWVAELLAQAWAGLVDVRAPAEDMPRTPSEEEAPNGQVSSAAAADPRAEAQRWLRAQGYQPSVLNVGWRVLMWAAGWLPWLHTDDHPPEDLAKKRFQVSMPASIEAFVRATVPGARRIEFCHRGQQVVVHEGWTPIADGCQPDAGDTVLTLE